MKFFDINFIQVKISVRTAEIVNGVYCYLATGRVKRGKTTTTAKTTIFAESTTQARNLLHVIYGDDSVVSASKVSESDLNETVPNNPIPRADEKLVPIVLPTAYTHKLAQNALANKMKRNALQV